MSLSPYVFFEMLIQKAGPVKGALASQEKAGGFSHAQHAEFDFGLMRQALGLLCCNMKCRPLRSSTKKS
jgi:hypothetical protein